MCTIRSNGHRVAIEVRAGGPLTKRRPPLKGRKHQRRLRGAGRTNRLVSRQAARIGNFIADLLGIKRRTPRG